MLRNDQTNVRLTSEERQALTELALTVGETPSQALRRALYREASRYGLLPPEPPFVQPGRPRKTAVEA